MDTKNLAGMIACLGLVSVVVSAGADTRGLRQGMSGFDRERALELKMRQQQDLQQQELGPRERQRLEQQFYIQRLQQQRLQERQLRQERQPPVVPPSGVRTPPSAGTKRFRSEQRQQDLQFKMDPEIKMERDIRKLQQLDQDQEDGFKDK